MLPPTNSMQFKLTSPQREEPRQARKFEVKACKETGKVEATWPIEAKKFDTHNQSIVSPEIEVEIPEKELRMKLGIEGLEDDLGQKPQLEAGMLEGLVEASSIDRQDVKKMELCKREDSLSSPSLVAKVEIDTSDGKWGQIVALLRGARVQLCALCTQKVQEISGKSTCLVKILEMEDRHLFQIVLKPKVVSLTKRGADWRKAEGKGSAIMKCQTASDECSEVRAKVGMKVGNEASSADGQENDFSEKPNLHLKRHGGAGDEKEWDFKQGIAKEKDVVVITAWIVPECA